MFLFYKVSLNAILPVQQNDFKKFQSNFKIFLFKKILLTLFDKAILELFVIALHKQVVAFENAVLNDKVIADF